MQEITHFHLFGGAGAGAAGFMDADPSIGGIRGKMRLLGGIDVDPLACKDFKMLTGVDQTCADLFSLEQYRAWHGRMPPEGWREATAATVRAAAQNIHPNLTLLSAPCKGFSGLQSPTKAATAKYVALNELTLRGIWLMLEAFIDDLPGLIAFENVPRIKSVGRNFLDQIIGLLQHYGYAVAETTHDCGELGEGLGQSRRRYLLVARLVNKIPPFLYEPTKRPLRSVGEILNYMPLPGDALGGPMHRVPSLQWGTWTRLALVTAGSDWRSLNQLKVENGYLTEFLIVPNSIRPDFRAREIEPSREFNIQDPRFEPSAAWQRGQALGVRKWDEPTGTVAGQQGPLQGAYSVADPRPCGQHAFAKYAVTRYCDATGTVIAGSTSGQGAFAVADPRPNMKRDKGAHFLSAGHYGVVNYADPVGAISASACHDNGPWSVADPRPNPDSNPITRTAMPAPKDKLIARITSMDNTWHRPFTTLELAALQSFIDPEEWFSPGGPAEQDQKFVLAGNNDQRWREAIGNAIPRKAAKAIGTVMGQTILLAQNGETFVLGSTPIWVRPIVAALAVAVSKDMK